MRPRPYRRHVSHPSLAPVLANSPHRFIAPSLLTFHFSPFTFHLSLRLLLAAAVFATFTLAGCDSPESRADLVVLNGAEPESIDPAEITGQLDGRVAYALFEGLLHFDGLGRPLTQDCPILGDLARSPDLYISSPAGSKMEQRGPSHRQ